MSELDCPQAPAELELHPDMALHVLRIDPGTTGDAGTETSCIALPSSLRFAGARRRREFLAGRRCALACLGSLGQAPTQIPMGPDGAPVWPIGYQGSIGHCEQWAVAAATRSGRLRPGVDCEALIDPEAYGDIAALVATPQELLRAAESLGDPLLALTVIFSAKESAYKALRPDHRKDCEFSTLRVEVCDPSSGELQVTYSRPAPIPIEIRGRFVFLDSRHLLTLAALHDVEQAR